YDHLLRQRLDKVERLRRLGHEPYPIGSRRTHLASDILAGFEDQPGQQVCIAGRLVGGKRVKGGQSFAHLLDDSGRIQASFRRDLLEVAQYELFVDLVDPGDFLQVCGETFRTRSGEISVQARELVVLAKALREPPEKWH